MAKNGEVYRGLSIIGQAPLSRDGAPPSPLSFKLFASNSLAGTDVGRVSC